MDELLTMSVKELARRIREGGLSPVDVLEAHIKRIEEVNPKINAVIAERFDDARAEARAAAERLAKNRDDLPPLFGVPCTIKDCFAVKGLPWSGGVWNRRDLVPDFDATVVERAKNNGAIVMGKTNVPEASMWFETYNTVYGRTNNPYDLSRGAGGSSGGEGAIVAAGGSPFGIAADIGGSIRFPSAFNGVAGHKHTATMLPGTGHWPPALGPLAGYNTYGPIARRVEDLAYITPLLAGPDGKDPVTVEHDWTDPGEVDVSKLRVFYFDNNGLWGADRDVRRAVSMAAGALGANKVPVEHWRPEGMAHSFEIWIAGMAQNPEPFIETLAGDGHISVGSEFIKLITRESKMTAPAFMFAAIEKPGRILDFRNRQMLALAAEMQAAIEQKLGDDGVLVCPVFSTVAPKHTWIWLQGLGAGYSGVINILQFPATVVPVYHREDGMPVSVQVVAGRWKDHLTLAAAKVIEEAFGGWKPRVVVG